MSTTNSFIVSKQATRNIKKIGFFRALLASSWLHSHIRACKNGLQKILQRPLSLVMIVFAIGLSLSLPSLFFVLLKNAQHLNQNWDNPSKISLFLKMDVNNEKGLALTKQLQSWKTIHNAIYIPPSQGWKNFKQQLGLEQLVAADSANPLPGVIEITPMLIDVSILNQLAKTFKTYPEIERINFNQEWAQRLNSSLNFIENLTYGIGFLLCLGIVAIIATTIHLSTEREQEEIAVFQLVGANLSFIRRPFLYKGLAYGLLGAVCALLIVSGFTLWLSDKFTSLTQVFNNPASILGMGLAGSLLLLTVGGFLGWIGSWIILHSHLTLRH